MNSNIMSTALDFAKTLSEADQAVFFRNLFQAFLESPPAPGVVPCMEQFAPPHPLPGAPLDETAVSALQSDARPPTRRRWVAVDGLDPEDVGEQANPVPHSMIARPPTRRRSLLSKDPAELANSEVVGDDDEGNDLTSNGGAEQLAASASTSSQAQQTTVSGTSQKFPPSLEDSLQLNADELETVEGTSMASFGPMRDISEDPQVPSQITVIQGPCRFTSIDGAAQPQDLPQDIPAVPFQVSRSCIPTNYIAAGDASSSGLEHNARQPAVVPAMRDPPPPFAPKGQSANAKGLTPGRLEAYAEHEEFELFQEFEAFQKWQQFRQFQQWKVWYDASRWERGSSVVGAAADEGSLRQESEPVSGVSHWSMQALRGDSPAPSSIGEIPNPKARYAQWLAQVQTRPWDSSVPPTHVPVRSPKHASATASPQSPSSRGFAKTQTPPDKSGLWNAVNDMAEENPQQLPFLAALMRDIHGLLRDEHSRTQLARLCSLLKENPTSSIRVEGEAADLANTTAMLTEYLTNLLGQDAEPKDPQVPARTNATPRNTPMPSATPLSGGSRPCIPSSVSWDLGLGVTPPTTPSVPAMMRSYASSEDLLRIFSERMLGMVSPMTPQTAEDTVSNYNAQLGARLALLKLTLNDLQRERRSVPTASPTLCTPTSGSHDASLKGSGGTPGNTPHPSMAVIAHDPDPVSMSDEGVHQTLVVPSQGATPPPTPFTSNPVLTAKAQKSAEELKKRLSEGLPQLQSAAEQSNSMEVEEGEEVTMQLEVETPSSSFRHQPAILDRPTAVPKNTPVCQSPATICHGISSPQPMSPMNAGKEAFGFGGSVLLNEPQYKLPAQTPPSTPAIHTRPPTMKVLQAEVLPHKLAERLQRVQQGGAPDRLQAASRHGVAGRAMLYHEQEELWKEYQRTLQQQAMIIEQERLQQIMEHQKLEKYELIVTHRENLRNELQQLTGSSKGFKFDQATLTGMVSSLWQFVDQLLPSGTPHNEFRNCLQQAVLKYEGCDVTFHKDRLLQDVFDLLCDELLYWQKVGSHGSGWTPTGSSPKIGASRTQSRSSSAKLETTESL